MFLKRWKIKRNWDEMESQRPLLEAELEERVVAMAKFNKWSFNDWEMAGGWIVLRSPL